ncbi:MAG: helix-turn-helix domain-containing protein [Lachnospiraceae bacterium]
MDGQKILAARIADLCGKRRYSYYELAYKSAVPLTTLMHIIDGTTKNPGLFTISKLCGGLGITLKEFFDVPEFEGIEENVE